MKRKHRTRRRRSGLSEPGKRTHRRRRRSLSEGVMSGNNLKNSAINTGLAALGGAGASVGFKLIQGLKMGIFGNILTGAAVGFVASALGAPKMGIGFTGGTTALALAGGMSEDNAEFADDDVLSEDEVYMSEDGEYMRVLNDGTIEPLSEDEIQALSEGEQVYPTYSTMNPFQQ